MSIQEHFPVSARFVLADGRIVFVRSVLQMLVAYKYANQRKEAVLFKMNQEKKGK